MSDDDDANDDALEGEEEIRQRTNEIFHQHIIVEILGGACGGVPAASSSSSSSSSSGTTLPPRLASAARRLLESCTKDERVLVARLICRRQRWFVLDRELKRYALGEQRTTLIANMGATFETPHSLGNEDAWLSAIEECFTLEQMKQLAKRLNMKPGGSGKSNANKLDYLLAVADYSKKQKSLFGGRVKLGTLITTIVSGSPIVRISEALRAALHRAVLLHHYLIPEARSQSTFYEDMFALEVRRSETMWEDFRYVVFLNRLPGLSGVYQRAQTATPTSGRRGDSNKIDDGASRNKRRKLVDEDQEEEEEETELDGTWRFPDYEVLSPTPSLETTKEEASIDRLERWLHLGLAIQFISCCSSTLTLPHLSTESPAVVELLPPTASLDSLPSSSLDTVLNSIPLSSRFDLLSSFLPLVLRCDFITPPPTPLVAERIAEACTLLTTRLEAKDKYLEGAIALFEKLIVALPASPLSSYWHNRLTIDILRSRDASGETTTPKRRCLEACVRALRDSPRPKGLRDRHLFEVRRRLGRLIKALDGGGGDKIKSTSSSSDLVAEVDDDRDAFEEDDDARTSTVAMREENDLARRECEDFILRDARSLFDRTTDLAHIFTMSSSVTRLEMKAKVIATSSSALKKRCSYFSPLDEGGDENLTVNVETLAAMHLRESHGLLRSTHGEGAELHALFTLLMWDVLFTTPRDDCGDPLPVFLSRFQRYPLDLFDRNGLFYARRQKDIERTLDELRACETHDLARRVREACEKRKCFRAVGWHPDRHASEDLGEIARCIGGKRLASLFAMMCKDYGAFRGGAPDLLLWGRDANDPRDAVMLVEVKSKNDTLALKQIAWLSVLAETCGIPAGVLRVSDV